MNEIKVDDVSELKSLGSKKTKYPNIGGANPKLLEKFPNKFPGSGYDVRFYTTEFTSLCPKTGQPDFAEITIDYVPDKWCVESKGLKLYLFSYRTEGSFMETITNRILNDLVSFVKPRWMVVTGNFAPRGGIGIVVKVAYDAKRGVDSLTTRVSKG